MKVIKWEKKVVHQLVVQANIYANSSSAENFVRHKERDLSRVWRADYVGFYCRTLTVPLWT